MGYDAASDDNGRGRQIQHCLRAYAARSRDDSSPHANRLRKSETLTLRWENVALDAAEIRLCDFSRVQDHRADTPVE